MPAVLLNTRFDDSQAAFSPDGKWLAFVGNDTGGREVFVRPFPDVYGSLTQISSRGGRRPVWSRTGEELLFIRDRQINGAPVGGDELVSVSVDPGTSFDVGEERVLFSEPLGID